MESRYFSDIWAKIVVLRHIIAPGLLGNFTN